MEHAGDLKVPKVHRHGPMTTPQADQTGIQRAAEMLTKAQSPLIITRQSGRNHATVSAMTELAELIGAPVVSEPVHMNFPSTHPMWAGPGAQPYLAESDVILTVDHDVPYIPVHGRPRPDAQIIQIDIDPVKPTIPLWVFPNDLSLHADSSKAVPALVEAVKGMVTEADRARIEERFEVIKERHERRRAEAVRLALGHSDTSPITPQWLSHCINEVIAEDDIVLDECVTNSDSVLTYIRRSQPVTYYKSGGSSPGWGLGASLGAKLAAPDRTVVAALGDGSFIYGCPTSTLWAADVHGATFLAVIYNNELHHATKRSLKAGYPDGYSASTNNWIGMELAPSVDFAMVARACRAYGETVDRPDEVKPALERGLNQVKNGKAAVLAVRIERP